MPYRGFFASHRRRRGGDRRLSQEPPAVSNKVKNFGPNKPVTISVSAVLPPDVYNALPASQK